MRRSLIWITAAAGALAACGSDPPAAIRADGSAPVTTTSTVFAEPTPPSTTSLPASTRATSTTRRSGSGVVGTTLPVHPSPGGAARVQVLPTAVDLRPRPFESAVPVGERQVAVRFYSGVAPCDVLGRVGVVEAADRVTITLFSGRDASAADRACIELAVYNEVLVDLASPLGGRRLVDGAG